MSGREGRPDRCVAQQRHPRDEGSEVARDREIYPPLGGDPSEPSNFELGRCCRYGRELEPELRERIEGEQDEEADEIEAPHRLTPSNEDNTKRDHKYACGAAKGEGFPEGDSAADGDREAIDTADQHREGKWYQREESEPKQELRGERRDAHPDPESLDHRLPALERRRSGSYGRRPGFQ